MYIIIMVNAIIFTEKKQKLDRSNERRCNLQLKLFNKLIFKTNIFNLKTITFDNKTDYIIFFILKMIKKLTPRMFGIRNVIVPPFHRFHIIIQTKSSHFSAQK